MLVVKIIELIGNSPQGWQEATQNAIDEASRLGYRWIKARILLDWAEAHIARGDKEYINKGKTMMQEAQAEFEDMGADGWVERIMKRRKVLE